MDTTVEREIKLPFESPPAARQAVLAIGGAPHRPRRLQDDRLVDWPDNRLGRDRCLLRVRQDGRSVVLTYKGPPQDGPMKVREELETEAGSGEALMALLERLGLRVWFRYQKYREEFLCRGVVVAIDETPIGTYVELEGSAAGITELAKALGRGPHEYVVDSYRDLFLKARAETGLAADDMVFRVDT